MASLDRIRPQGFRCWYERQLIECHAWLVSWFLGLIVLVSGIEVAGQGGASRMSAALSLLGGLAVTLYSWKRYRLLVEIAECLGEQAVCPGCQTYGKFKVQSSGPAPLPDGGDPALENHGGGVMVARPLSQVRRRVDAEIDIPRRLLAEGVRSVVVRRIPSAWLWLSKNPLKYDPLAIEEIGKLGYRLQGSQSMRMLVRH